MLHGVHGLHNQMALSISHLASLNPHAGDAIKESAEGQGSWLLPRAAAPLPATARHLNRESASCGVSAFAFQGTNAHVVVAVAPAGLVTPTHTRSSDQVTALLVDILDMSCTQLVSVQPPQAHNYPQLSSTAACCDLGMCCFHTPTEVLHHVLMLLLAMQRLCSNYCRGPLM